MKRLTVSTVASVIALGLAFTSPVSAGLFDELKKKAKEAVTDLTEDKAEATISDLTDDKAEATVGAPAEAAPPAENTASLASSVNAAETTTGGLGLPTTPLKIAKGILAAAPDLFSGRPPEQLDERKLKDFILVFYPDDRQVLQNEFKWRKERASYEEKLLAQSKDAPTSFPVAPWLNNAADEDAKQGNDLTFSLGQYDFDREAWPVSVTNFQLPWLQGGWKYSYVSYEVTNADLPGSDYFIPMSPDLAEKLDQLKNDTSGRVFGRYSFTITDVVLDPKDHPRYAQYERDLNKLPEDRRNSLIAGNLPPLAQVEIDGGKVELYLAKGFGHSFDRDDYIYLGTLDAVSKEIEPAEKF